MDRQTLENPDHNIIYGAVLDLREDFIDLKKHVNDELEVQKHTLDRKADKTDLTLWIMWKQSPTWMKVVGAAVTAAVAITSAVAAMVPMPLPLPF
jgi:hypothetical protein